MSDPEQQPPAADGSGNQAAQPPVVPGQAADNTSSGSFALPDSQWIPFIRECYPRLHEQPYFFTPLHFNRVPFSVKLVAGQTVIVFEKVPCEGVKRCHGTSRSPLVAGSVFTHSPTGLKQEPFQESDMRDDDAQQCVFRCLQKLPKNSQNAMMIISQLQFKKYLSKLDSCSPSFAAAVQSLPNLSCFQKELVDGECDILGILHCHGFFIGEIKSVGAAKHFKNSSLNDQNELILKMVNKGMKQLNNQDKVVTQLVSDSPHKVTKALILPNLTSTQLKRALSTADAQVVKGLCDCLNKAPDVATAIDRCLCADQMASFSDWWEKLFKNVGPDPNMNKYRYEQLVARFCGPATTVEIPTVTSARKVIRTLAEAVAETGLMMSHLALYPEQVNLLNRVDLESVYLWGPPGCGKTVLLVLKAVQLLKESVDVQVIVMSICCEGLAVSILMERQIRESSGAASNRIQRFGYSLTNPEMLREADETLMSLSQEYGRLHIIVDEVEPSVTRHNHFENFFRDLHHRARNVSVWAAGVYRPAAINLPWMPVEELSIPLRCPPKVHEQIEQSKQINGSITPRYSQRPTPAPTDGPEIWWLTHKNDADHSGRPLHCRRCGQNIAKLLKDDFHVGQRGVDRDDGFCNSQSLSSSAWWVDSSGPTVPEIEMDVTEEDSHHLSVSIQTDEPEVHCIGLQVDIKSMFFHLLEFNIEGGTNEMAIVPDSWLVPGTMFCRWPPGKFSSSWVRKSKDPEDSWITCEYARHLKSADSFQRIKQFEEKALFRTDLDTSQSEACASVEKKRKRVQAKKWSPDYDERQSRRVRRSSSSSSSHRSRSRSPLSPTPPPQSTPRLQKRPTPPRAVIMSPKSPGINGNNFTTSSVTRNVTMDSATLERLFKRMEEIKSELNNVSRKVDRLFSPGGDLSQGTSNTPALPENFRFPLEDLAEIQRLNVILQDELVKRKMVRYLANIGGSDAKDALRRILKLMMKACLFIQFNLTGKKGKLEFNQLSFLKETIYEGVRQRFQSVSLVELDFTTAKWLTGSIDRDGNKKKREDEHRRMNAGGGEGTVNDIDDSQ